MDMDDFSLMCKGYFDKRKKDELNFANVAFIIDAFATGLAGNKANYKQFINSWFGEGNNINLSTQEGINKVSAEIERRLMLNNKILEEKEKIVERNRKKNGRAA